MALVLGLHDPGNGPKSGTADGSPQRILDHSALSGHVPRTLILKIASLQFVENWIQEVLGSRNKVLALSLTDRDRTAILPGPAESRDDRPSDRVEATAAIACGGSVLARSCLSGAKLLHCPADAVVEHLRTLS